MKLTAHELEWRLERVASVESEVTTDATAALLDLTYHEKDRAWLQEFLLRCTAADQDPQIRALATTCLGHIARIDGSVSSDVRERLNELLSDAEIGGIAEDALGDVVDYVDPPSTS